MTFVGEVTVPRYSQRGTWKIDWTYARDVVGNTNDWAIWKRDRFCYPPELRPASSTGVEFRGLPVPVRNEPTLVSPLFFEATSSGHAWVRRSESTLCRSEDLAVAGLGFYPPGPRHVGHGVYLGCGRYPPGLPRGFRNRR